MSDNIKGILLLRKQGYGHSALVKTDEDFVGTDDVRWHTSSVVAISGSHETTISEEDQYCAVAF